ncbi:cytochrome c [Lentisphaera profundi]|uniref:Cytochrome c n=1 Tax=Lentisphaera profundi TaxID=1658616 RepID=A0ABY7W5D3_9BACT|nr:cytochrome c [Lentisphaera profundi]WDE99463.1 cytochrome c [Lentisphaera profundi]
MRILIALAVFLAFAMPADAKPKKKSQGAKADPIAKKLFEANCLACHDPLKTIVGPTLHEIHKLYEKNPQGIVTWAKKPGRKRLQGIAMPAMAHLPDKDLKLIADYMIFAGARISPKKSNRKKTFKEELGKIQRTFMPNSSVVSFAIKFSDNLSLCWDADKASTRYIWRGTMDPKNHFISNGKTIPAINGETLYKSDQSPFLKISDPVDFLGYNISPQGLPEFLYKRGDYQFSETLIFSNDRMSWTYRVSGPSSIQYSLPRIAGFKVSTNTGQIKNQILHLSKTEMAQFTLTFTEEK